MGDSREGAQVKLQIDVDGVLADFPLGASKLGQFLDAAVDIVDVHGIGTWQFMEEWGHKVKTEVWTQIKTLPLFFYGLSSLLTREEWVGLRNIIMERSNEVYFVTSRPGKTAKWQTEAWLYDRLEVSPTVIIASDKGGFARLVKPDWSIEDNAVNAFEIGQVIGPNRSCIIDRLYNRDLHPMSATRVKTFKEFLEKIQ